MTFTRGLGIAFGLVVFTAARAGAQQDSTHRAPVANDTTHRTDSAAAHDSTVHDSTAHDSTAHARKRSPRRPVVHDTISGPPISPVHAMLYSFAVPGLGESKLGRTYTGAFFFSIEAICFAQLRQAIIDRHYASHHSPDSVVASYETDPTTGLAILDSVGNPVPLTYLPNRYANGRLGARALHVEDWVAALIFNHLISGADAFVSAQLWDLPKHIQPRFSVFPDPDYRGRTMFSVSFPAPRFARFHW